MVLTEEQAKQGKGLVALVEILKIFTHKEHIVCSRTKRRTFAQTEETCCQTPEIFFQRLTIPGIF
jgi:hypothetical protein